MDLLPDHIFLTYLDVQFEYGYFYTYSLQFCQWHKSSTGVSIFSTPSWSKRTARKYEWSHGDLSQVTSVGEVFLFAHFDVFQL